MEDLSKIRQNIFRLNQKRWSLLQQVMKTGKLLSASFYERYTKCGSPNCKCAKGELHGPFPWIYQNRKGQKLVSTSCPSDKVGDARLFSENYKVFKENCSQIRKLDEEIGNLIMQIETLSEVDVREFTRKEGEKRGRKQKKSEERIKEKEN
jgi:hypothetical protein